MSEVKVNKISPRTNCGTVTLGDSGDTFTIPSGATITNAGTASGFGATGEISWDTTVKTTGTFTATAGVGYFCNTTGGTITVNLPAGAAGSSVALADYAGTWQTSNVTVSPNGTEKMGGVNANITLSTEGQSVTFVYIDGTQGWVNVLDSTSNVRGNSNLTATGGTITTSGNCKIHTFTGPGTFTVSSASVCAANNVVSYLVVAGGGGGGSGSGGGGGGGGGGFRELSSPSAPYTASPLNGYPSSPNRVTVTAQAYPIVVGGGGNGSPATSPDISGNNTSGSVSTFSTITSAGGGFGGSGPTCGGDGADGGSGGGGRYSGCGGAGNTPPTSPAQGTNGGSSSNSGRRGGGGGGGATVAGTNGTSSGCGVGGTGATTSISTSPVAYSGGGGGAGWTGGTPPMPSGLQCTGSSCGTGGKSAGNPTAGVAGTTNRGGGGGGTGNPGSAPTAVAGNGGSGIVIIRYKFQ